MNGFPWINGSFQKKFWSFFCLIAHKTYSPLKPPPPNLIRTYFFQLQIFCSGRLYWFNFGIHFGVSFQVPQQKYGFLKFLAIFTVSMTSIVHVFYNESKWKKHCCKTTFPNVSYKAFHLTAEKFGACKVLSREKTKLVLGVNQAKQKSKIAHTNI